MGSLRNNVKFYYNMNRSYYNMFCNVIYMYLLVISGVNL